MKESRIKFALEAIARTAFTDSRFYADPNFSREQCADLYARWIAESARGFADALLVTDRDCRRNGNELDMAQGFNGDVVSRSHNGAILDSGQCLAAVGDNHERPVQSGLAREATGEDHGRHIIRRVGIHFDVTTGGDHGLVINAGDRKTLQNDDVEESANGGLRRVGEICSPPEY